MLKRLTLAVVASLAVAVPAWSQKASTPSADTVNSGRPCVIASSTMSVAKATAMKPTAVGKSPVATADTTGVAKPFKLVSGDPDLPKSAHPGGDEELGDRINDQNNHNPANGTHTTGGSAGSPPSSGGGSTGGGTGTSHCR